MITYLYLYCCCSPQFQSVQSQSLIKVGTISKVQSDGGDIVPRFLESMNLYRMHIFQFFPKKSIVIIFIRMIPKNLTCSSSKSCLKLQTNFVNGNGLCPFQMEPRYFFIYCITTSSTIAIGRPPSGWILGKNVCRCMLFAWMQRTGSSRARESRCCER